MMNVSEKTLQLLALKKGMIEAEQEREEAERNGIQILSIEDALYPSGLKALSRPPAFLWVKGDLRLLEKTLGIVGTRNATLYGREIAYQFSKTAASRGTSVISGLARGVDTEAHKGALAGGKTVAVIGSGLLSIYPAENKGLAEKIGQEGLLLSEYSLHTPPNKFQFPARNRIIAALSEKLLVIEAPLKSGSLITVEEALLLKKPVFALPGRIDWENFAGNHQLIKEGRAKLVTSIDELVEGQTATPSLQTEGLLSHFGQTEIDIDTLLVRTKWPLSTLNAQLMRLVLQGKIRQIPGGFYKKSS